MSIIKGMAPLLQVFDMPTSIVFYRDVLGFEVVATSQPGEERFGWALLRLNGFELMLNTAFTKTIPVPTTSIPRASRRTMTPQFTSGAPMWMQPTNTFVHASQT